MIKFNKLILSVFLVAMNSASAQQNTLKEEISGKTWCLDDSYSFFLEDAPDTALTESFDFRNNGEVVYKIVNIKTKEIIETVKGIWSANKDKITLKGNGETDTLDAKVEGDQLMIFERLDNEELFWQTYNVCSK